MEKTLLESEITDKLKTVYDPEIPVNIYELGLIYEISISENNNVDIKMTLTSPNCPVVDSLLQDVYDKVKEIESVNQVMINIVFDPPWNKGMMSDTALLELGLL